MVNFLRKECDHVPVARVIWAARADQMRIVTIRNRGTEIRIALYSRDRVVEKLIDGFEPRAHGRYRKRVAQ
jgi:hypothetical protein